MEEKELWKNMLVCNLERIKIEQSFMSSMRSQAVILNCICWLSIIVLEKFLKNAWPRTKYKLKPQTDLYNWYFILLPCMSMPWINSWWRCCHNRRSNSLGSLGWPLWWYIRVLHTCSWANNIGPGIPSCYSSWGKSRWWFPHSWSWLSFS